MSIRRRRLIVYCSGDREQVRFVEGELAEKAAARRKARRKDRERRERLGLYEPRPNPGGLRGL